MFKIKTISKSLLTVIVLGGAIGIMVYFLIGNAHPPSSNMPLHQFVGLQRVHAVGQGLTCSTCHSEPIPFSDCADCHTAPPLQITDQNINFIHHNPFNAPDDINCQDCHASSGNDARFVQVPIADHSYCDECHSSSHD